MASEPGKGTRFDVYLPATTAQVEQGMADARPPTYGEGRILVLDDEESIRRLTGNLLSRLGYEAECVADGSDAVVAYARARHEGRAFDAVLMDLTIPGGMGGLEAGRRILEIDPDACTIVCSGYSDDPVMAEYADYGFHGVVAKPYDIVELSRVLARVLSTRPSS